MTTKAKVYPKSARVPKESAAAESIRSFPIPANLKKTLDADAAILHNINIDAENVRLRMAASIRGYLAAVGEPGDTEAAFQTDPEFTTIRITPPAK